ncbi:acyltransferase [candidate division KSB1 bacterium]|nr:acyltransferase [candidate division KSB1 bacterium]
MNVGYIQFDCEFGRKDRNLSRVEQFIGKRQADLWVLPELFNSGYLFTNHDEVNRLSEPIPAGETCISLIELSRERNCTIVAGLPEAENGSYYNSAVCVSKGRYLGKYRKCHLFDREKLWFKSGDQIFDVINIDDVTIGIMICFDWIFPEAARSLALKGADIICHPSNLVLPYCQQAMITRSIENRIFSITSNRVGEEQRDDKTLRFTGMSQIVSPTGEVIFRSKPDREEVKVVTIDPCMARNKMMTGRNHLFNDRQPELYFS